LLILLGVSVQMLSPQFLLTKKLPFIIIRKTQGSRNEWGEAVPGIETEVVVEGNLQPMGSKEILQLPESERTKEWYKFYTSQEIRTLKEGFGGWQADEIIIDGSRFRFMKVKKYSMGILDHYRGDCARVPSTPN